MSNPPHNPHSPGSAQYPQAPYGQQPVYQQQHYAQGGWGGQTAQPWVTTPAPQKSKAGLIAILVAVAVLVASTGIWAVSASGRNKAEPAVEAFFELLNTQKPSYREFTQYVTGIDFSNVYDATRHSPGGTWSVVSVGEIANDKVAVTYKHNDKEFTSDFELRQDGRAWKLYKPFAYITFTSNEQLRFVLTTNNDNAVFLKDQMALFPGTYTITPIPTYSGDKPTWQPSESPLDLMPGVIETIQLKPKLTDDAAAATKKAATDAFATCLKTDSFYPSGCPFRADRPANANHPAQVAWDITPADAPSKAILDEASGVTNPCYQIKGTMKFSYVDRTNVRQQSTTAEVTATGCVRTSFGTTRVTWKR